MRFQARRGNGRYTRNTMENTLGLHVGVCESCRRLNPYSVGEPKPETCHACGSTIGPRDPGPVIQTGSVIRDPRDFNHHARTQEGK